MVYDNAAKTFGTEIDFAEKMLAVLGSSELRHLKLRFGALPWRSFGENLLQHLTTLTLDFECKVLDSVSPDNEQLVLLTSAELFEIFSSRLSTLSAALWPAHRISSSCPSMPTISSAQIPAKLAQKPAFLNGISPAVTATSTI